MFNGFSYFFSFLVFVCDGKRKKPCRPLGTGMFYLFNFNLNKRIKNKIQEFVRKYYPKHFSFYLAPLS